MPDKEAILLSHPSRVRGLKQPGERQGLPAGESHPSRVRGLKLHDVRCRHQLLVAPLAGAWIETCSLSGQDCLEGVAPLAGAWIETPGLDTRLDFGKSHPSRVRGLKRNVLTAYGPGRGSHPSRVRGLKHACREAQRRRRESHPSRVRGLKQGDDHQALAEMGRTPRGCVD